MSGEQNIHEICHAVVKEVSTGKEFADTQDVLKLQKDTTYQFLIILK